MTIKSYFYVVLNSIFDTIYPTKKRENQMILSLFGYCIGKQFLRKLLPDREERQYQGITGVIADDVLVNEFKIISCPLENSLTIHINILHIISSSFEGW